MSVNPVAFSEDHVRAIAHSLWLEEGMPHGRAEAHWFKALEMVNAEAAPVAAAIVHAAATKPKRKAPAAAAAKKAAPRKKG